jgi:hypothetical protein
VWICEATWPLVSVHDGPRTAEETRRFLARADGWLARGARFGLLLHPGAPARGGDVSAWLKARWARRNRPRLSRQCFGIASVVTAPILLALSGPLAAEAARATFGCPGAVFGAAEEAERWLTEQMLAALLTPGERPRAACGLQG